MAEIEYNGKSLPIRKAEDGSWEVENKPGHWIKCESKEDAIVISNAPLLRDKAIITAKPDKELAAELEATSDILERYRISVGARFFREEAKGFRCEDPDD